MKIPKDKAVRIGRQLIVPQRCGEVGLNIAKRSLLNDILEEVAKKIKITETETENGVKLSVDILLVNFEDLKETQGKDEHTTDEQKAKEICDCDSCKACSKFAEDGAAYAFIPTCDRFNELMQAMQWKDEKRKELWRITRNHYQEWAEEQERQLIDNLREVLSAHMHGGEIDEVLAELDEKMK